MNYLLQIFITLSIFLLLPGNCMAKAKPEVVIYTTLDQIFSEPILKEFESLHDIRVKAVYDIEAVKTTGLVNRLIAEQSNPRCDVFWNSEILRTIILKQKSILVPYYSPSAADIPPQFKDKDGYWAGFAARARVLVVNTDLVKEEDYPTSIDDLSDPKWRGRIGMANPLFGTTATHVSALLATKGYDNTKKYLQSILANDVKIVDGNSVVRDMTGNGVLHFGITDTDDVSVGIDSGMPIAMILPDQNRDGTLLIPNTISLIKGAPHIEEAKLLIDYLLSRTVEEKLAHSTSAQIPLRAGIKTPKGQLSLTDIASLEVDYEKMAAAMDQSIKLIQQLFIR